MMNWLLPDNIEGVKKILKIPISPLLWRWVRGEAKKSRIKNKAYKCATQGTMPFVLKPVTRK